METWSVDQVCSWLVEENLGQLVHRFQEEEVNGAALLALNDRMVQQLVKKIGHQAILMDLIKKYKQKSQELKSLGSFRKIALVTKTEAAPDGYSFYQQSSSLVSPGEETPSSCPGENPNNGLFDQRVLKQREQQYSNPVSPGEKTPSSYPGENSNNGLIDQRVLKQRRNMKHVFTRNKVLLGTSKSYVLPEFPYDVKHMLAEQKYPDHIMRIRIIEFLQADMTKSLEGSLYPTTQQYNDVVSALLQAYPFLDENGRGFFLWKRALKNRFKYVRRPIEDDEQVMRNKSKFGHRKIQTRKSLADRRFDDIKIVQIKAEEFLDHSLQ